MYNVLQSLVTIKNVQVNYRINEDRECKKAHLISIKSVNLYKYFVYERGKIYFCFITIFFRGESNVEIVACCNSHSSVHI